MKFGAHVSIAGGLDNAPLNAAALGCETFQMFSRSPRGGVAAELTNSLVKNFKHNCQQHSLENYYLHAPYYINLASGEERIYESSIRVLREELERGTVLGARGMMAHLGSAKDLGEKEAMTQVGESLVKIVAGYTGSTKFLIELSAGAGMIIGDTFDEVSWLIDYAEKKVDHEFGVCLDTQHAFASGYDLRTAKDVKKTFNDFDRAIGLDRLMMMHCNDSKVEFGARRDRHEHLGQGKIGLTGFEALVREPRLQKLDLILETAPAGVAHDLEILKSFRL